MKNLLFITFIAILLFTSCSKEDETIITAKITWEDNSYFDLSENWKAAVYKEAFNFMKESDYSNSAIEVKNVAFKAATVQFIIQVKDYQNYTIVIFNDKNKNSKFDKGENYSYTYEVVEGGENIDFPIEVMYQ